MRERDGSIPADLLEWIKHRRELGQSGALAVFGQFFDDLISSYAEIMGDDVHECEQAVWSKYNIDVADGHIHPVTGVACKDKSERVDEHGEMTSLGLMIDFRGLGRISYGSLKKFKYTRKGSAITSAARSAHPGRDSFRIDRQGFHSWAGQLGFLGQVDINAYGLLNQLRAHLPPGWERRQHFQVSAAAVSLMEDITSEIHNDRGMALFPDMSPPGTLRQAIWTFTDAARRPDAHHDDFVGFGGWFWNPASPTEIPYFLGEWTHHEQRMLPSTELELHTKNMVAQLADRTGWFSSSRASLGAITSDIAVDLIQAGDNSSASGIAGSANSGHASSHAVRALLRNRSLWLQSQNIRTFSTHLVREYNVPADHLSNGKTEEFKTSLSAFFGADLRFKDITGSIPPEFRSLEPALLASKQAAAAAKMKSKHHRKSATPVATPRALPGLASSRGATAIDKFALLPRTSTLHALSSNSLGRACRCNTITANAATARSPSRACSKQPPSGDAPSARRPSLHRKLRRSRHLSSSQDRPSPRPPFLSNTTQLCPTRSNLFCSSHQNRTPSSTPTDPATR